MKKFAVSFMMLCACVAQAQQLSRLKAENTYNHWVGTWACAPQPVVKSYMPFNNEMTNRSVRQVVKVSVGGDVVRLHLSNVYSTEPVEIRSVYISAATDSFAIAPKTTEYLRFHGRQRVVIAPGASVVSDAERFHLRPLQLLAITINYRKAPKVPTVHMGSRTTSYILRGYSGPYTSFAKAFREEHWFNIAAIDVYNRQAEAVAIIGNSITDGKNSTDNRQDRWPDRLSEELHRQGRTKGILNLGIGNNRVLSVGLGAAAKDRFDRDILQQHGVKTVIVFEGVNDLGVSNDAKTTARRLIEEYNMMIRKAHERHLKIYGATIMPMRGCAYFTPEREEGRRMVNEWMRTSKAFDGVIDFDELMRDAEDHEVLRQEWQSDWLHPNAEGYAVMGRFAAQWLINHE
ncbi:MAG TPA: SGNH/GDSL hydrolase family protein [Prevotella sp.]